MKFPTVSGKITFMFQATKANRFDDIQIGVQQDRYKTNINQHKPTISNYTIHDVDKNNAINQA